MRPAAKVQQMEQTKKSEATQKKKQQQQQDASNNTLLRELGMKAPKKRTRTTEAQVTESYAEPFKKAVASLLENKNDPGAAKLTKTLCAAVLTLGFGKFTRENSCKIEDLRKRVKDAIADDAWKQPGKEKPRFWAELEKARAEKSSSSGNKRKRDDSDSAAARGGGGPGAK